jgi:hypothetical protein
MLLQQPIHIHVFKCSTGSGDVDTSKVVKADDDGSIVGASGWSYNFLVCLHYSCIGEFQAIEACLFCLY